MIAGAYNLRRAHIMTRGVQLWTVKIANARSSGKTRPSRKSDISLVTGSPSMLCLGEWKFLLTVMDVNGGACISTSRSLAGLALPRRARSHGVRPKHFIFVKAG